MTKPVPFKRGSTFSFALAIPDDVPDGTFVAWKPMAQIRRARNDSSTGLIADIAVFWADPLTTRVLVFHHNVTEKWPVGEAELDVLFLSAGGQTIRSSTVLFDIQRGITK